MKISDNIWPVHGDYIVATTIEGKDICGWFHEAKSTATTMAIVPDRGATKRVPTSQVYSWHHYNWGAK